MSRLQTMSAEIAECIFERWCVRDIAGLEKRIMRYGLFRVRNPKWLGKDARRSDR